ncbi:hypothetical protein TNCV_1181061 [Trichonephila clavipes]|nr:hypothetical protein TNCV_1181061 [Trichonephila clavipes]
MLDLLDFQRGQIVGLRPAGATGQVCVWRAPAQACDRDDLLPTVKHGGRSVMIWKAMSLLSDVPIGTRRRKITGEKF